jgi:hypothetical protein
MNQLTLNTHSSFQVPVEMAILSNKTLNLNFLFQFMQPFEVEDKVSIKRALLLIIGYSKWMFLV